MDIKIIDDFLDKEEFNTIKYTLLHNSFPWFLRQVLDDEISQTYEYNFQFVHMFFDEGPSVFFDILNPVLNKLEIVDIDKIKSNLLTRTDKIVKHGFHVDNDLPKAKTAVLYFNDNNGYTIFEKTGEKVYSKENRIVIFDNNLRHTGTTCTDTNRRVVMNINFYEDFSTKQAKHLNQIFTSGYHEQFT